nr:condensation domain-containing protein [Candidatus Eremiobacteraeota bacterium]
MSAVHDFLEDLNRLDIALWAEGDRLRYSAPEGVLTPGLLERIRERKRELIDVLRVPVAADEPALRAIPRDGAVPLSYAQQRLWLLEQLGAGGAAYLVPAALELDGELDVDALQRGFDTIVRRHEILRTAFVSEDGLAVARIDDAATVPLRHADLSPLPHAARD